MLPISTVITKDDENYIYTVENNVAKKTPVTVGIKTGEAVEITSDLAVGTQVVTRGQTYLSDGEQVEIANPTTPVKGSKEDTAKEE